MRIDIPKEIPYSQLNKGDFAGVISYTRNITFDKTFKKFYPSPRVITALDSVTDAELTGVPVAFAYESGTINSFTNRYFWALADNYLFESAGYFSGWDRDDGSTGVPMNTEVTQEDADMISFNLRLYIASYNYLYKRTSATYTAVSTDLTRDNHVMSVYGDRLYIAGGQEVASMTTGEVISLTGGYTLDIDTAGNENLGISCMRNASNGLWIGTYNSRGGRANMFFWDGVTENIANTYRIDTHAIMSLVVKDDKPYILTAEGILMTFNGSFFVEVGRIGIDDRLLHRYDLSSGNDRWIHPNGMAVVNDEIYMLINSRNSEDVGVQDPKIPSGIWAYNKEIGVYHKYSISLSKETDTDGGVYTDYGQVELMQVGAIYPLVKQQDDEDLQDQSEFMCGCSFSNDLSTETFAIAFMDMTQLDHSQDVPNAGVLTTNKIQSQDAVEMWNKLWVMFTPMENSTDKIVVKYRTQEYTPVEANITWVNTTSFTSTDTDFATIKTNFEAGIDYEIEVLKGDGAGMLSHITNITYAAPTYTVTVDTVHTGVTTRTAKVRADRWNKLVEITDTTNSKNYEQVPVNKASTWVQYKFFLLGNYKNPTIERFISSSTTHIPV